MTLDAIAKAVAPDASHEIVGIRPGEKRHEQMIGVEDARFTYEYDDYYKILPMINDWYKDPVRIGRRPHSGSGFQLCQQHQLQLDDC